MNLLGHITNNTTENCFFSQVGQEVNRDMLSEMKAFSPGLLVAFSIVNLFLGVASFAGNALVILTIIFFSELRQITTNIGLASLATVSLFHGTILNSFLFAVGVNTLLDGCPIFRSTRFAVFYLSHTFIFNSLFNLCIVTAERYIAVAFPLRYFTILPKERMVKVVRTAWLASFLVSVPNGIDKPASQTTGKLLWFLTISLTLAFTSYCNIKMFVISRRHKRQVKTQLEAVQQIAVKQQSFRGAGTVFCVLVTVVTCYVPAILVRLGITSTTTPTDKNKLNTVALIQPWTSTFYVMYSALSPFLYFFRCKRLRKYSRKLFTKALRFIRASFL